MASSTELGLHTPQRPDLQVVLFSKLNVAGLMFQIAHFSDLGKKKPWYLTKA
jgi:hypothetical protein